MQKCIKISFCSIKGTIFWMKILIGKINLRLPFGEPDMQYDTSAVTREEVESNIWTSK
jgi:hypothetical protein